MKKYKRIREKKQYIPVDIYFKNHYGIYERPENEDRELIIVGSIL
jgi:hypothetical protein